MSDNGFIVWLTPVSTPVQSFGGRRGKLGGVLDFPLSFSPSEFWSGV